MSSMPALYELTGDYQRLKDLEQLSDLPAEAIRDTLEALEGDIQAKSTNVAMFVQNLEASADAIDAAAKAMQARAQRVRGRAESVRNYLLFNLQAAGIKKVECPQFTIAVRDNPPALVVDDFAEIPADLMRPPPPAAVPNKSAIKKAIEGGREIKGCYLTRGQRLEIKT